MSAFRDGRVFIDVQIGELYTADRLELDRAFVLELIAIEFR